jgi:hypothetical protein
MITKSTNHNPNYLASIVKIDEFRPHINPKVERMKMVNLFGNSVITGIDAKPGVYIYFPLECAICQQFLSYTNSFRDKELNTDKNKSGFFEMHGRVRAVKLQGSPSEGYIVPASQLENFCKYVLSKEIKIDEKFVGTDFDEICGFQICKKYIPKGIKISNEGISKKTKGNVKKYQSKLVENQFRFHPSTEQLKRNIEKVSPNDYISVLFKYHGTSFVTSNVIVKKKLSFKEKIAKLFRVNVIDTEYGMLYSSRSVLKNIAMDDGKQNNHYYDSDVWKIVSEKVFPCLKKGFSAYGEIVGYTPSGAFIQKNYDYSCSPGTLDYIIYRMTYTNVDGDVFELSYQQMVDYCNKFGLKTPHCYYYGKAKDLYPELNTESHWHENFLNNVIRDYLEKDCMFCKSKPNIPDEGIVLRVDKPNVWEVYKLKSFRFTMQESAELDQGILDIETQETLEESLT